MYRETEINGIRKSWVALYSDFIVGQKEVIDPADRKRIATAVSNTFHRKKLAKFKIFKDKTDGNTYIKREE